MSPRRQRAPGVIKQDRISSPCEFRFVEEETICRFKVALRFVIYSIGLAAISQALGCYPARQDPVANDTTNIVTYSFSGSATCSTDYASICGSTEISITGTYTLDPDEEYYGAPPPPGSWDFSIASSDSKYNGISLDSSIAGSDREDDDDQYISGADTLYFESPVGTSDKAEVNLTFDDPGDGGTILPAGPGVFILNNGAWAHFLFNSGTSTITNVAAEPPASRTTFSGPPRATGR